MTSRFWQLLLSIAATVAILASIETAAQSQSKTYADSRGKKIVFPLGDASFADEIVSFELGNPAPPDKRWANPKVALGVPDYKASATAANPTDVVLGCSGTLTIRFVDNALVDVAGPDLYVFEAGPAVEAMQLAISIDGATWIEVGKISGGTAEIDISKAAKAGERYRYVRVTDLKASCTGQHPGADIDAIGAIGSALAISFDSSVLFGFDESTLRPQAQAALLEAAKRLAAFGNAAVTVEGHTDNVGAADYNMKLSQARADAVRSFLLSRPELSGRAVTAKGFGATKPIAPNTSEEGRQKNRRVELVIDKL
jgi:outer membrane protein OmpA-like peptidoglycan-associated protein